MTDHDPMPELDDAARAASRGLRGHVEHQLTVQPLPPGRHRRSPGQVLSRVAIVVVVMALVGISLVAFNGRDGTDPSPDVDQDLPAPIPLTPLGPRDGKASIGLPVTVGPNTGLVDGQTITATGNGFTPDTNVAIVQCALEAGRPAKGGEAAGVDGCDIAVYTSITSSSDGIATGDFQVHDHLTTPATGTIDCTIELGRCIIAMAEVNDYDRSGGFGIGFGTPDPTTAPVPTMAADPSVGLTDAQVIHVTGTDLTPGPIKLEVCSVDPAACWATGSLDAPGDALVVSPTGTIDVDVPAWRFLPGPEPRSYIDCAISACNLVATTVDGKDPIPVRLGFVSGGPPPTGPAVEVVPDQGVSPGALVDVRGAGFETGTSATLSFCISPPDGSGQALCLDLGEGPVAIGADGVLQTTVAVPPTQDLGQYALAAPSTSTTDPDGSESTTSSTVAAGWPCDGTTSRCVVRVVVAYGSGPSDVLRPRFEPDPVALTYRKPG